jgi:hypothetical protein
MEFNKLSKFIIIYPYKFHEFTWKLLELEYLLEFCDVLVIDVSQLLYKDFSDKISSNYYTDIRVIKICTYSDFIKVLKNNLNNSQNVTILNEVPWYNLSCFIFNLVILYCIKNIKVKMFDMFNGGVPYHLNNSITHQKKNIFKIKFKNIVNIFISKSLFFLSRFVNKKITHRLVAGEKWNYLALKTHPFNVKIVLGHSNDFSDYLIKNEQCINTVSYPKAVLLDSAGPAFISDAFIEKLKIYRTVKNWYPALVNFFNHIESKFGLTVEIAGHYKSKHEPYSQYFGGNRLVKYNDTCNMVKDSKFVITLNSTAISYAVIYNKPILFIYSNELLQETNTMNYINDLSNYLGTKPLNIDNLPNNFSNYLNIDYKKYERYKTEILTSTNTLKPNYKIILNEIIL